VVFHPLGDSNKHVKIINHRRLPYYLTILCEDLGFFWLGHRPHLRIKDIFQKEIKGCWKNRKSFPIIPNNAYEHLKLLKSTISATGREFLILPLWHSLNSNKGGDEYEI